MKRIHVAAGILRDQQNRVLISERVGDGPFHGMWEFPGGKVGSDEASAAALERELEEELGIAIDGAEHFMRIDHDYADRRVSIDFYLVSRWFRQPVGREGQKLRWVLPDEIGDEALLPADAPVLAALRQLVPG